MSDNWTNRLSEYLDGDLSEADRTKLEVHLRGCDECAGLVSQLAQVKQRAEALEDEPPQSDLWQGIQDRIRHIQRDSDVVDLAAKRDQQRRRLQFTVPQLVAAGFALIVVSAGSVWLAKPAAEPRSTSIVADVVDSATAVAFLAGFEMTEYDAAVAELEGILRDGRDQLDPSTAAALQQSLATIDRAIQEAYEALRADPVNTYLSTHLAASMTHKIKLLQHAASLTTTAS
jgi:anti-sigma factor ChrR (cupin superfamily)